MAEVRISWLSRVRARLISNFYPPHVQRIGVQQNFEVYSFTNPKAARYSDQAPGIFSLKLDGMDTPIFLLDKNVTESLRDSAEVYIKYYDESTRLVGRINKRQQFRDYARQEQERLDVILQTAQEDLQLEDGMNSGRKDEMDFAARRFRQLETRLAWLRRDEENTAKEVATNRKSGLNQFIALCLLIFPSLDAASLIRSDFGNDADLVIQEPMFERVSRVPGDGEDLSIVSGIIPDYNHPGDRGRGDGFPVRREWTAGSTEQQTQEETLDEAVDAGPVQSPRSLAEDAYHHAKYRLRRAQDRFEDRRSLQREMAIQQRLDAGEENTNAVVKKDTDLRAYQAGQVLTRELIIAEAEFQATKRKCQDIGLDITYDDDLSSVFPGTSQDGFRISDGFQDERQKNRNAPAIIAWCETLPDLIDGILADQESFTFVPDCDDWTDNAGSLRDFDSGSVQETGKKRKRIDEVADYNKGLRDAAVDHWARTQKRSKTLFHEADGLRVYTKEGR
ncbi:uncharacterized protein RCC_09441 [Ramularia collo-cygni]|uniref:Uncharacterized protein n=1 Tax=Ramularia collo-cygni TaxID=112498 RepID=A0A2D3V084_9PEZI|nr:uncharacterized protein RCC_09441 [Ramularia collo-cygni]CZT23727.1 uncharacterized protein RCC_09441 [Ramularia collo-cygni]